MSNGLDPDQDRQPVGSDLGPYCLQRLYQQMTKVFYIFQGRARAREAEYIILIEEENFDEFESQLKMYRNIEQVSLGAMMAL